MKRSEPNDFSLAFCQFRGLTKRPIQENLCAVWLNLLLIDGRLRRIETNSLFFFFPIITTYRQLQCPIIYEGILYM